MSSPVKVTVWLLKRALAFMLPLSMVFLAFITGALVATFELPPHREIRQMVVAAVSFSRWLQLENAERAADHPHIIVSDAAQGNARGRFDPARAHPGVTMAQAFTDDRFAMVLLGADRARLHRWDVPDAVYERIEEQGWEVERGFQEIMGGHMYPDGDVLGIIYQRGVFRLDRCSRLKWFRPGLYHHDAWPAPDGSIWTLSAKYVTGARGSLPRLSPPYYDDTVQRLSPDGELLEEFSVLEAIYRSGYQGLVLDGKSSKPQVQRESPIHVNDIEIVGEAFAARHDFAGPGDILLSLRAVDAILLLDRNSKRVKWALSGLFLRQHDPDLQPDGTISIYDNRTETGQFNLAKRTLEEPVFGWSRLLRFDPATQQVLWQFQGSADEPFYSSVQGDHQVLPKGNVMAVETEAGRIIEIDPRTNEIVWEWFNVVPHDERNDLVGRVTRAYRYDADYPNFLDRDCPAGD